MSKEYVFSFIADNKKQLGRFAGETEDAAFAELKKLYPNAKKLAGFEMDDKLAKILDAVQYVKHDDLDDALKNQEKSEKVLALQKMKDDAVEFKRQKTADAIEHNVLSKGEMAQEDWNTLTSSLSEEEKKSLYQEFIDDANKNHTNKDNADLEKKFINYIFNVKEKGKWSQDNLTIRDIAKIFGVSHVRVLAIQKAALTKLVNNIAKIKKYPFKITTAEEAIALLLADNIANPEDLKLKTKVNGGISFEEALKKMVKLEKERKQKNVAFKKADEKKRRQLMAEFKQLEKETNALRDKLGLPRQYENFFKFFAGQKFGNF